MNQNWQLAGFALIFAVLAAAPAPSCAQMPEIEPVELALYWLDTRPDDSVLLPGLLTVFHGGEVDFHDHGRRAPDFLRNHAYLGTSSTNLVALIEDLADRHPQAVVQGFFGAPWRPPAGTAAFPEPEPYFHRIRVVLDPTQHRFLSWFGTVHPADDAFLANEDPYQIELFDAEGRFKGPQFVDLRGNQVMDAGVCYNDEEHLMWLHQAPVWPRPGSCRASEGEVRHHPGLRGSLRNPEGAPGVLGAHSEFTGFGFGELYFDPVRADFTRPGFRFGRLLIERAELQSSATGSWYSPERAGEGFNIEILEAAAPGEPARILVHWFTYADDDSGEQVWLSGLATLERHGLTTIELVRSTGGRFASTDNPETVQRQRWGELDLLLPRCADAEVRYRADAADTPPGAFTIHRLSPAIEGLDAGCPR